MLAFTYLFLAVATVDYVILLVLDPVDPRLVEANYK